LPVSNHTSHRCIKALEQHFTGMAQAWRSAPFHFVVSQP
jgi:hypothetical protein